MTVFRVVVAERKDLATVTVICPECGCRTSFDHLEWDYLPRKIVRARRIPEHCAACEAPFSDDVLKAVAGLMAFHHAAAAAEKKADKALFQFEIRQPE